MGWSHPPHGGCGLKSHSDHHKPMVVGHPPHGGCGLKLLTFARVRIKNGHPPHGGCGLKSAHSFLLPNYKKSPSTRRVWIEMVDLIVNPVDYIVTLHTEGVD